MKNVIIRFVIFLAVIIMSGDLLQAHCDQMNGPLIADARKAIDLHNVNFVLKWVPAQDEKEINQVFDQMMEVRNLSDHARNLSEKYFFETLVRIHRAAEGVPFTGVKPEGTPIDERVLAADKAIETGDLSTLEAMVSEKDLPELKERFSKVMSLKNHDVNNVAAGRAYIEAYVRFFKFAEGESEGHDSHAKESAVHQEVSDHTLLEKPATRLPWYLSGLFFISTMVFGGLYFKRK